MVERIQFRHDEELRKKAIKQAKNGKMEERRKALAKTGLLLLERSLEEWPSILEDKRRADGLVLVDLYSIFMYEPPQNLHLGISLLLKKCLVQYLSSDTVFSLSLGPAGKRKKLSVLKTEVLRTCSSIMSRIEKKDALLGLHVDSAKKEKTEHLSCLLMKKELPVMLEGKDFYVSHMVFPFVAAFIDSDLSFEQQCEVTRVSVQYNDMISKVLVDHVDVSWGKEELCTLRSEIAEFKTAVKRVFHSHCLTVL